ncbi:MAG: restriction endonuclease subunit S [Candidatus Binatia bacterium]
MKRKLAPVRPPLSQPLSARNDEVPVSWQIRGLGELADVDMGQSPPSRTYNESGKGLPFLQGAAEFGYMAPTPKLFCSSPVKIANAGDILISVRAPVGELNIADQRYCIGRGLATLRAREQRSQHFLLFALQFWKKRLSRLAARSTFRVVGKDDLVGLETLWPSEAAEREKIAEILSAVDDAIQKTDEIIAATERLKKGLMQRLLTRGIGHATFKKTEIGEIPEEWEVFQLQRLVKSYKNGIYKPRRSYGKGYPSVRMYNIRDGRVNTIQAPLLQVTGQELEEYGLREGDVVINRVNTPELVGRAGVVPPGFGPATFESKNIRARLDTSRILPGFFAVFVQGQSYSRQVRSFVKTAVAQATITQEDLDKLRVPVPQSLIEQQKIVEIVSALDYQIKTETEERKQLENLKQGLMQVLLTGKVRVKV